jgi:uncharacterized membrane protein (UPF0182 family)
VYASPGASDAASSYPRLIRVAMMYNDQIGYGPTVRDALTDLFGPGADATATGPAPTDAPAGQPQSRPAGTNQPPAAQPPNRPGQAPAPAQPEVPVAVPPSGPTQLSAAKAAALQDVNSALDALQEAQRGGDFAQYGEALQRLDDAVNKYQTAQ